MSEAAVSPAVSPAGGDPPSLSRCVHCGLCLPVCPTFDILRDENDSPRGRLQLMKLRAEGRIGSGGAFSRHIDRCLGCRACEPACPAGVRFGALLESARHDRLVEAGGSMRSRLLISLFTGRFSAFTYALLRALRRTGLAASGSALPGRLGAGLAAIAASAPTGTYKPLVSLSESPPNGSDAGPFVLLEGCAMSGLFRHVHEAARRVLRASGFEERRAPGQTCCGALHAHAGLTASARRLAKSNIEAFERSEARWFVVDSSGCGAALKEYPTWLVGSARWSERAQRVADATIDVTRLVADSDVRPRAGAPGRVAYDIPCHLSYGLGDAGSVVEALSRVPGLKIESLPSADRCCGGAGLFSIRQPELSSRILEPKLREIEAGEYDAVVSGNPGCILQIGGGLRRAGLGVVVLHPIELLDGAIGQGSRRKERARGTRHHAQT